MSRALDLLDRYASLKAKQGVWRPIWQELAELMNPGKASFVSKPEANADNPEIYDGTPMLACRGLATAIDGLEKPSTSRWFFMRASNDALNDVDVVKQWFDLVSERMWKAIYAPSAQFIPQSGAVDRDIATFGWGPLWISENSRRNGLMFKAMFIGDTFIDENADGLIDTVDLCRRHTARQWLQRYPEEKLPPKVKEALRSTNKNERDKQFEFIQCIYPREERDAGAYGAANLPYASTIVAVEDEEIMEDGGYEEFPMAIPRWEIVPGQVYPRSAGMLAAPDSRTLQTMGLTLLTGGQMAVDPPRWIVDDGSFSSVRTGPGGLVVFNAETIRDIGGAPMGQLDLGANLPVGREMQADYRDQVRSAFYESVLSQFTSKEDPQKPMTAYEVSQRKEEFLRTIGPTLGQLENDYIGAIVTRVFGIMSRIEGVFPEPPEELVGAGARFEFMSPVQRAKKQIEAASLQSAFAFIGPLAQVQPEIVDNFDGDAIVRDLPDAFGLPQKWLKPKDKVEEDRAQRQQDMQSQQALAEAESLARTNKDAMAGEKVAA